MFRRHPIISMLVGLGGALIGSDLLLVARRKNLVVW
jgi:hypothetical protein